MWRDRDELLWLVGRDESRLHFPSARRALGGSDDLDIEMSFIREQIPILVIWFYLADHAVLPARFRAQAYARWLLRIDGSRIVALTVRNDQVSHDLVILRPEKDVTTAANLLEVDKDLIPSC